MDHYLRKPVGLNDLADAVAKGLKKVAPWRDLSA